MEHGLKDFEGRVQPFTLFVENQSPLFHAGCGEEGDIAVSGELLGRTASGIGVNPSRVRVRRYDIQVIRNQGFVGYDKAERELL